MSEYDKEVLYDGVSPNGRWRLTIYKDNFSEFFRTDFSRDNTICGEFGGSFGRYRHPEPLDLSVRWDLPDGVCGIFLGDDCYMLIRAGAGRQRRRTERRYGTPFTSEEIDYFCAKRHYQYHHPIKMQRRIMLSEFEYLMAHRKRSGFPD